MTETEWLTCDDPHALLRQLRGRWSDRKERLFSCACCRRIWNAIKPHISHRAVELAEAFADGLATRDELAKAKTAAWAKVSTASALSDRLSSQEKQIESQALLAAAFTADPFAPNLRAVMSAVLSIAPRREIFAHLVREIFGNPFRQPTLDLSWLSWSDGTIGQIARYIDENRAFGELPILGDALEDAGCDDVTILEHCRQREEHVRGCWVLDLLLRRY